MSGALATDLHGTLASAFAGISHTPAWHVPNYVVAGVIQVYWLLWSLFGGMFAISRVAVFFFNREGSEESKWIVMASVFCALVLAISVTLVFGFLGQKPWAYGLFLRTLPPILVGLLVLWLAGPEVSGSSTTTHSAQSILNVFSLLVLVIQVLVVVRSKGDPAN